MKYGRDPQEDAGQLVKKPRHDRSQASGDAEKPRAKKPARAANASKE
jgi:hypothetical protein